MNAYDHWKTTPPPEPPKAGECAQCGADLYEGCEYVYDDGASEWFCDSDCYFDKMSDLMKVKTLERDGM